MTTREELRELADAAKADQALVEYAKANWDASDCADDDEVQNAYVRLGRWHNELKPDVLLALLDLVQTLYEALKADAEWVRLTGEHLNNDSALRAVASFGVPEETSE